MYFPLEIKARKSWRWLFAIAVVLTLCTAIAIYFVCINYKYYVATTTLFLIFSPLLTIIVIIEAIKRFTKIVLRIDKMGVWVWSEPIGKLKGYLSLKEWSNITTYRINKKLKDTNADKNSFVIGFTTVEYSIDNSEKFESYFWIKTREYDVDSADIIESFRYFAKRYNIIES